MARNERWYYHAGVRVDDIQIVWSTHTRRTIEAARVEARRLARRHGGQAIVEWWDREHGLQPGWDCATGAEEVAS